MVNDELIKQSFSVQKINDDLIEIDFTEAFSDEGENSRQSEMVEDRLIEILNQNPNKTYNLIVDLLPIGGFHYMSSRSREVYAGLAKLRHLKKTAVVGNNTFLEIIVNLIMQSSGKAANFHWFKSKEEALTWVK